MHSHKLLFIYSCVCFFSVVLGQYQMPDPTIEAFTPRGFKIHIPNEKGMTKVAFHIKVNEQFTKGTKGQLSQTLNSTNADDVWEYKNDDLILKNNDVVHYWMFAQVGRAGFRRNPTQWSIRELIPLPGFETIEIDGTKPDISPEGCILSNTITKGKRPCKGQLLFEEEFSGSDLQKDVWKYEQYIPRSPDYEFVSYQTSKRNVFVENGMLHIKPTLLNSNSNKISIFNGSLDLRSGCTKTGDSECFYQTRSYNILPPIVSGKITTKKSFSFQYGRIDIKAKFPEGDWIYPQLFLLPTTESYGLNYDSGVISVASVHGNEDLRVQAKGIHMDSRELYAGMMLGKSNPLREIAMKKYRSPDSVGWNKNFHVYSFVWKPGSMTMMVNNKTFATYQPPDEGFGSIEKKYSSYGTTKWSNPQAPFDKEFYISLAVVVGGVYEFPAEVLNKGRMKPWVNDSPKYLLQFWQNKDEWYQTWDEVKSDLQIDSIRVWAL